MSATQPDAPPPPPPPPQPPAPPGTPVIADAPAVPRTAAELRGLREQRSELSDQLISAQGRRRSVARDLERTDDATAREGLRDRLTVLDRRIMQLETDIAETGRRITTAPPELIATSEASPFVMPAGGPPEGAIPIAIVFILFVLFPLALSMSRSIWRRSRGAPKGMEREAVERLARLEQAVDAIAIEVERVSEGQRFVTRVLAESRGAPAIAAPEGGRDVTREAVPMGAASRY